MIDLVRLSLYFILDSILWIVFGYEVDFEMVLIEGVDKYGVDYLGLVERYVLKLVVILLVFLLRGLFVNDFILKLIGLKVMDKVGLGLLMRLVWMLVGERFGEGVEDRKDMLVGFFFFLGFGNDDC